MVVTTVERAMRPTYESIPDVSCVDDDVFGVLPLGCVAVAGKFYNYVHIGTLPWFEQGT